MTVAIYTDGACEPNPGFGGWAFVVYRDGEEAHSEWSGEAETTNNIMEMMAVIQAIEWVLEPANRTFTTIYSDSQYVVKGCNTWRHAWKAKGWKRKKSRGGGEVKNLDLWKRLDALLSVAPVKIEWVRGHIGIVGNERADELSLMGRVYAVEGQIGETSLIAQQLHYEVA